MKLKSIVCACSLLISLFISTRGSTNEAAGTFECVPIYGRDTRPQPPKANLTQASLEVKGAGYILNVTFNDKRGKYEIPLNSKLHLISKSSVPYTLNPLAISPDGKFNIAIVMAHSVCTFSGTAQLSSAASAKLFGTRPTANPKKRATNTPVKKDSCAAAVERGGRQLKKARYTLVSIERHQHGYTDYPDSRSLVYNFVIRGLGDDIFSSPAFLTAISKDVISNCESVGLITLSYAESYSSIIYAIRNYGLMANGKVESFKCDENMPAPLKWGYEACPEKE